MKNYEIMTIGKISLGDDGATTLSNTVKDLISGFKGKVLDNNLMGKRKFAYEIDHQKEGYYDVVVFEMNAENLPKFRAKLNLTDGLLRYLITAND